MYIPIEVSLYARVYLFHWSIGAVYVCYTLVFQAETHRILMSYIFDDSTVLARWSAVETQDIEYVYSPLLRGLIIPRGGTCLIYRTFVFYCSLFSEDFRVHAHFRAGSRTRCVIML